MNADASGQKWGAQRTFSSLFKETLSAKDITQKKGQFQDYFLNFTFFDSPFEVEKSHFGKI